MGSRELYLSKIKFEGVSNLSDTVKGLGIIIDSVWETFRLFWYER